MTLRLRDRFLRWLEAGRVIDPQQKRDIEESRRRLNELVAQRPDKYWPLSYNEAMVEIRRLQREHA